MRPASIASIGKEMNALEEQLAGIRQTEAERGSTYRRSGEDPLWDLVVEVIRLPELPVTQTAASTKVSSRTIARVRAEQSISKQARSRLTRYAIRHASEQLRKTGAIANPHKISPQTLLATYLDHTERQRRERLCARAGCPNQGRPTSAYCSDRCARAAWQAAYRKRTAAASPRVQRRDEGTPVDRRQDSDQSTNLAGTTVWAEPASTALGVEVEP